MLFRQHKQKDENFRDTLISLCLQVTTTSSSLSSATVNCEMTKKYWFWLWLSDGASGGQMCMSCWVWREMKLKIHNIQHSIKIHWRVNTRHNSHLSLLCVRRTQKQRHEIAWRLRIKLGCSMLSVCISAIPFEMILLNKHTILQICNLIEDNFHLKQTLWGYKTGRNWP